MKVNFSEAHLSLRRRIWIAISLVSVIPAVVVFNYFSGYSISAAAFAIVAFLILLGWWIIIEILTSIYKIYNKSKKTLDIIGEEVPFVPDEVQNLEEVINLLSNKVKTGFEELKEFGHKTEKLNKEVSKKVHILSTILQANDLYSKNTPAEEVIQFLAYHLKNLLAMDIVFCVLQSHFSEDLRVTASLGIDSEKISQFVSDKDNNFLRAKKLVIVDRQNQDPLHLERAKYLGVENLIILPIISKGIIIGLAAVGTNYRDFVFQKDDIDVLNLFAQNVTLIWEYERVSSKVEELEMFDGLTGLYNLKMLKKRLEEEIKRGVVYQRPCGFVAVKFKNYSQFQEKYGVIEAEKTIKKISRAIKESVRPIDVGGRIASDVLGVILIESNKRQSNQVCQKLSESLRGSCGGREELGYCVAESPIDGVTAEEILSFVDSRFQ